MSRSRHRLLHPARISAPPAQRVAGANDHESQSQSAEIALARGLLAEDPSAQRAAIADGLAEISAMAPQSQQMRSIREIRAVLEAELARIGR